MTATAHLIVGGAIASTIANPVLGVALAVVSHPLLDMVPHWDVGTGWSKKSKARVIAESAFDVGFGAAVAWTIFSSQTNPWYLLAAMIGSISFDLANSPYWFLGWKFPPFTWIDKLQSEINHEKGLPWGLINQIAVVSLILLALFSL